jgi:serine/threonine protein kinase
VSKGTALQGRAGGARGTPGLRGLGRGLAVLASGASISTEDETHCPYIVSFYDVFADAKHGCLNLVVEYMNGGSLQDLVDRGGFMNEDVLAHISYCVLMVRQHLRCWILSQV